MNLRKYQREYRRRWRAVPKNRKQELARRRKIYAKNPALELARKKRFTQQDRQRHLGRRKRCDICRKIKPLVIDHDHQRAGRLCFHDPIARHCRKCRRGALCVGCNTALGKLGKHLARAVKYLKHWRRRV